MVKLNVFTKGNKGQHSEKFVHIKNATSLYTRRIIYSNSISKLKYIHGSSSSTSFVFLIKLISICVQKHKLAYLLPYCLSKKKKKRLIFYPNPSSCSMYFYKLQIDFLLYLYFYFYFVEANLQRIGVVSNKNMCMGHFLGERDWKVP